jgi:hypothetical protein
MHTRNRLAGSAWTWNFPVILLPTVLAVHYRIHSFPRSILGNISISGGSKQGHTSDSAEQRNLFSRRSLIGARLNANASLKLRRRCDLAARSGRHPVVGPNTCDITSGWFRKHNWGAYRRGGTIRLFARGNAYDPFVL